MFFHLSSYFDTTDMFTIRSLVAMSPLALAVFAAFPPTPENVTTIQSIKFPGVSISYKEVTNPQTRQIRTY